MMTEFDLDMEIINKARDKAFNDHINGNGYNNPYLEGSLQFIMYKDEWERCDYADSQILANNLEAHGL